MSSPSLTETAIAGGPDGDAIIASGSDGDAALARRPAGAASRSALERAAGFLELTKPRIVLLVLVTTLLGFVLANGRAPGGALLLVAALAGTALATGGANALNMCLERDADARMLRTRARPLPAGLIAPGSALAFGVVLASAGVLLLAAAVNLLTALLGAASVAFYVFLYTPLKRRSPACTLVGAVPGAIPPVMGWTAARDALAPEATMLFAILFLWQIPHFLAIAWMYREDYARGGFPMLSVVDPGGASTARQTVLGVLALIVVSLVPTLAGMTDAFYFFSALAIGLAFLAAAVRFAARLGDRDARVVFVASIVYLPILLTLLALTGSGA
jgi:protoheme IX farnesyltransferase